MYQMPVVPYQQYYNAYPTIHYQQPPSAANGYGWHGNGYGWQLDPASWRNPPAQPNLNDAVAEEPMIQAEKIGKQNAYKLDAAPQLSLFQILRGHVNMLTANGSIRKDSGAVKKKPDLSHGRAKGPCGRSCTSLNPVEQKKLESSSLILPLSSSALKDLSDVTEYLTNPKKGVELKHLDYLKRYPELESKVIGLNNSEKSFASDQSFKKEKHSNHIITNMFSDRNKNAAMKNEELKTCKGACNAAKKPLERPKRLLYNSKLYSPYSKDIMFTLSAGRRKELVLTEFGCKRKLATCKSSGFITKKSKKLRPKSVSAHVLGRGPLSPIPEETWSRPSSPSLEKKRKKPSRTQCTQANLRAKAKTRKPKNKKPEKQKDKLQHTRKKQLKAKKLRSPITFVRTSAQSTSKLVQQFRKPRKKKEAATCTPYPVYCFVDGETQVEELGDVFPIMNWPYHQEDVRQEQHFLPKYQEQDLYLPQQTLPTRYVESADRFPAPNSKYDADWYYNSPVEHQSDTMFLCRNCNRKRRERNNLPAPSRTTLKSCFKSSASLNKSVSFALPNDNKFNQNDLYIP